MLRGRGRVPVRTKRWAWFGRSALFGEGRQPGDEIHPILVIPEEGAPLQAPHHDVVEGAGRRSRAKSGTEGSGRRAEGIEARLAGHGEE